MSTIKKTEINALADDVESFIVVFATSSVSVKTIVAKISQATLKCESTAI
jgi:hypothetical protein